MNLNYIKGVSWFILSLIISNFNDVAAKLLIVSLDPLQVSCLRFLGGIISLIPCILYFGKSCLRTQNMKIHVIRGSLFYCAIAMWIWGVGLVPLATVTTISFTVPIFVLMLAPHFLKEKVSAPLWISTVVCLIGISLALEPFHSGFNPLSLILLCSSFMFATLDIINKKHIVQEGTIPMLFYSALISFICSLPAASMVWVQPSQKELISLALLGAGGNAILYCLLNSFRHIAASSLSPYRYLELIVSISMGYFYFNEVPTFIACMGIVVVVLTTLYITNYQLKQNKTNKNA